MDFLEDGGRRELYRTTQLSLQLKNNQGNVDISFNDLNEFQSRYLSNEPQSFVYCTEK